MNRKPKPTPKKRPVLALFGLTAVFGLVFAFSHAFLPNAVYVFLGLEAWKLTGGDVSPSVYGLLGLVTLVALGAGLIEWTARKIGGRTE